MQLRILLVVVLSASAVIAQDEDCDFDNADPLELANSNIFSTATLEEQGISEEEVMKQIKSSSSREITALANAQEELRASIEAGNDSIEYTPQTLSDSVSAKYAAQELAYFHPVCPYRYYWLSRYKWFFLVTSSGNRKFCWAYYSTYATSCTSRYCRWWYKYPYSWYFYYRCVPRYVYIWVYARCATYVNNTWVWSSQYVRVAVPRGCSCKRYWNPILVARQCPAAQSSLLD